jgi:ankyrin repeat protein
MSEEYIHEMCRAARTGSVQDLQSLIDLGYDVESRDERGMTPLYYAVDEGQPACVEALLMAGALLNFKDPEKGDTYLHVAANGGDSVVTEMLLTAGCDVEARNDCNVTPLLKASLGGSVDVMKQLIAVGASLHSTCICGYTALHWAAIRGSLGGAVECTKVLVEAGASVHATDRYNQTALHIATLSDNIGLVMYLVSTGVDVHAQDNGGRTACDHAIRFKLKRVAPFLVSVSK